MIEYDFRHAQKFRHHVFDLDDTLIDTTEACLEAIKLLFAQLVAASGSKIFQLEDKITENDFYEIVHKNGTSQPIEILHELITICNMNVKRGFLSENYYSKYYDLIQPRIRSIREAKVFLKRLLSEGRQLYIASNGNSERQREKMDRCGLSIFFHKDRVKVSGDYGPDALKPDPLMLREVLLQYADGDDKQVVYYGDKKIDFLAAKAAGISFVQVSHKNRIPSFGGVSLRNSGSVYRLSDWTNV